MRGLYITALLAADFLLAGHCILRTLHIMVSAIAVAPDDEPQRWPPLLGDIREATPVLEACFSSVFSSFLFPICSAADVCPVGSGDSALLLR
jgi:hypothetical protein